MRDSGNQIFMKPILDRIFELGFDEEIGTLVYSLENFDCSKILNQIVQLHFNCNYEVQMATLNMMEEQTFLLSSKDKEQIESVLILNNSSLNQLEVKFKLQD